MTLEIRILAFALHAARLLVDADGVLDPREQAFIEREFPHLELRDAGFVDSHGQLTEQYQAALNTALETLPEALTEDQKLDLIHKLFKASLADDVFEHREGNILLVVSRLLGLAPGRLDAYLSSLPEVGEVELD